ncbi:MAG: acyl carrier protein, partial [Vallitaleaceae bacterium]|nr:acyl carrier protein [Vallitaleaceae bacterium]
LGADSLDLFELVMSIEDTFGVKIPNEELANMKTVQDALSYVEAHQ